MKTNTSPTRQERNAMLLSLSKKYPWGVLLVVPVLFAVGEFLRIQFGEFPRDAYKPEFKVISILNVYRSETLRTGTLVTPHSLLRAAASTAASSLQRAGSSRASRA